MGKILLLAVKLLLLLGALFTKSSAVNAQDTSFVGPEPSISLAEIALRYYAIRWNDSQWSKLRGKEVEMAYLIDDIGAPFLRAVRGLDDQAVIDSLVKATNAFPYFNPATEGGISIESAYYLNILFPDLSKEQASQASSPIFFPPVTVDRELLESELYQLASISAFLDLGFHANNPFGQVSNYLKPGGGMDLFFSFHWKNRWGLGGIIGVEFNAKKQLFPVDPFPGRALDAGGGTYIGPLVEYTLHKTKQRDLALRGEVGVATAIAASKLDPPDDEGFVRYNGLHLGLQINYNFKFGKYGTSISATDKETTGIYHGLNLNMGLRFRRYGYDEINGVYAFFGVGYRLGMNNLKRVEGSF